MAELPGHPPCVDIKAKKKQKKGEKKMRKKTNLLKLLACAALALALCFGAVLPAMAAKEYPVSEGTEASPAEAKITKILKMPVGTNTPAFTFTFEFEAISVDDEDYDDVTPNMPSIADKTVTFAATDTGDTDGGTKTVWLESGNIVAPAGLSFTWPHAGIYVYNVTEKQSVNVTPTAEETLIFSQAEYEVTVYVANKTGGGLYVQYIEAKIVTKDAANSEADEGDKVDPTPGGGEDDEYSQMIFTNYYAKTNGKVNPETPDPVTMDDTVFRLGKTVAGPGANLSKYFPFEVKVTKPEVTVEDPQIYKAYVVEASSIVSPIGTEITASANVKTDSKGKQYIEFTSGATALTVNLKHGQKLVFMDLHVGSTIEVNEPAAAGYHPKYSLTLNGVDKTPAGTAANPGAVQALAIAASYIGEGKNKVDYTNTRPDYTPTGIAVDNLPYVVLIGLALAALASFGAVKLRKRAKQN